MYDLLMVKKIIKYPSESLRKYCRPVSFPLNEEVSRHVQDLHETLAAHSNGVALASNQIEKEGWQCFVVKQPSSLPDVCFNPMWTSASDEVTDADTVKSARERVSHLTFIEGCLSVPELAFGVDRHFWLRFEYDDEEDVHREQLLRGLEARIVQHECDHLEGKLIVDTCPQEIWFKVRPEILRNRKAGR